MIDISQYKKLEETGKDDFSKSFKIEEIKTNTKFSAKIFNFNLNESNKYAITSIQSQLNFYCQHSHPSIVQIVGISEFDFNQDSHPVLITEFLPKLTLYDIINLQKSDTTLTRTKKLINIYGIASAISYLSKRGVNRANLNPGRIYETEETHPKIFTLDFDALKSRTDQKHTQNDFESFYSFLDNIYSLGMIACLIVTGKPPLWEDAHSDMDILVKISEGSPPKLDQSVPIFYRELIESCFSFKKPNIDQILSKIEKEAGLITDDAEREDFEQYRSILSSFNQAENVDKSTNEENLRFSSDSSLFNLEEFENLGMIESNHEFKLYKIRDRKTENVYSAKSFNYVLNSNQKNADYEDKVLQQMTNILQMSHPSIIKSIGYSLFDVNKSAKPTIITEFLKNGNLKSIIKLEKRKGSIPFWDETMKLICLYGIASAMSYLHSKNILHRDLKPSAIILDDFLFPKLSFSVPMDFSLCESGVIRHSTVIYTAPELDIDEEMPMFLKCIDTYSFGCIVLEMLSKKELFQRHNISKFIKVLDQDGLLPFIPDEIPAVYKSLIERCIDHDPKKRPSFDEIVNELKTNPDFITEHVNESIYRSYIEIIEKQQKGEETEEIQENLFQKYDLESIYSYFMNKYKSNIFNTENINYVNISTFEKVRKIGSGGFGKVYIIKEKSSGNLYAAKMLKAESDSYSFKQQIDFYHELQILSRISNPCIVSLFGYSPFNIKNKRNPLMITEYVSNGSLEEILKCERKRGTLGFWNDTMKLINIYGIASAIAYLHSQNILHLDIKPKNVLVNDFLFPKLCDFGLSMLVSQSQESFGICGTPNFIPPEIYREEIPTKASDVYSFAVLVYEIMTKTFPFERIEPIAILAQVISGKRPIFANEIPAAYQDLIEKCWRQNPKERLTIDEVIDELKNNKDFITENVDEEIFHTYIDIIDQQVKGVNNDNEQIMKFHKYTLQQIYNEYET